MKEHPENETVLEKVVPDMAVEGGAEEEEDESLRQQFADAPKEVETDFGFMVYGL